MVTRGGDGAVAVLGEDVIACPAPAVRVVDTVGAGDAFTAACLAYLGAAECTPRRRAGLPPGYGGRGHDRERGVPDILTGQISQ
ncbi:PfkB family carbohydrate kinase [Microtetraspora sp. NBRC 13810]|uniref:PfkB family carbohydrate kinase n=1 Tax=Microtetraspora sp. NBRC 13810 TaxID=3030990 RepID=UPI00333063E0